MHVILVGTNHKSTPIELRERLAFPRERVPPALERLRNELGLREAAILSTCNRVEIYAAVPELDGTVHRLQQFLSEHSGIEPTQLAARLYSYTEPHSIHHLFAVASGLDSMVLGEAEILGQVRLAYERAKAHGATGKGFNVLFQRALNAAKTVRSQTAIGRGCTSVGAVAVELAGKIFRDLSAGAVVLIGAGKIGEVTVKRLAERGVRDLRIMNRSADRAQTLASAYQATPVPFAQLPAQLAEADILITSTSAATYLLDRQGVAAAMHARRQRPLCIVDLGVPRNVEPAVGRLENVYLFDVDSLQGMVEHYNSKRQEAVDQSMAILDRKVELFLSWWQREISDFGFRISDCVDSNPQSTIHNPQ